MNYMGPFCDGTSWGWCAEWGVGGVFNGLLPDQTGASEGYASSFGVDVANVTLRVGATRSAACGF